MPTTLITGANRGIGLALVREFIDRGDHVIATARDIGAATELRATGAELHRLDIADPHSIETFKEELEGRPVDRLINNAGIGARAGLGDLDYGEFEKVLAVNTIAPIRVTEALVDNVAASSARTVVVISSQLGSIKISDGGWGLIYRTSKAALNMAFRAAAITLAERGITTLTLHPGHVATDMGGKNAPVSPEQSARGLADVILNTEPAGELRFFDYTGKELPW